MQIANYFHLHFLTLFVSKPQNKNQAGSKRLLRGILSHCVIKIRVMLLQLRPFSFNGWS